jgi:hypothetical protein
MQTLQHLAHSFVRGKDSVDADSIDEDMRRMTLVIGVAGSLSRDQNLE